MNRRELLRNITAGTATLFFVPALVTSCNKEQITPDGGNNPNGNTLVIDLTDPTYSILGEAGKAVVVENVIIINTGDKFVALSSVCTHQGCQVGYSAASGNLPCPCHGSVFSITGSVLQGPASSPLKSYNVTQEGDILTINL